MDAQTPPPNVHSTGLANHPVVRVSDAGRRWQADTLIDEAPLEIQVDGEPAILVMRTPGHDLELAAGLLLSEAMIRSPKAMASFDPAEPEADTAILNVELADEAVYTPITRSSLSSASCGLCGRVSLDSLHTRHLSAVAAGLRFTPETILAVADAYRHRQPLFADTGANHASAAVDAAGNILEVFEDVGRHNATDKLIGHYALRGHWPLPEVALLVSGRISYEIVQKAIAAGFSMILAIGAPSSLAVTLANAFHVTLVGFIREGRFNVYTHAGRVLASSTP